LITYPVVLIYNPLVLKMSNAPTKRAVIIAAQKACESLSRCRNFFNFEENGSWRGWENWLTVDTVRRLNHKTVVRFGRYAKSATHSDIIVRGSPDMVVEIKVNYVDNSELDKWSKRGSHELPPRVIGDLDKLGRNGESAVRLMLVAIAFERKARQPEYKKLLKLQLKNTLGDWKKKWKEAGSIWLLALYKDAPELHKKVS
jgi:hypothetical protein